jgi:adenine phosphoribosyltransferase
MRKRDVQIFDGDERFVDEIKAKIREIPDFPKKGIMFRDITTLLQDASAFRSAVLKMASYFKDKEIDVVVSTESRGFIFGAPLAMELGAGFVPVRKKGKLPYKTITESYGKEYGTDVIELHSDALKQGQRVLVVDDLLATGGTIKATEKLVTRLGGEIVGFCFLIELTSLGGRDKLKGCDVFSLVKYDSEC